MNQHAVIYTRNDLKRHVIRLFWVETLFNYCDWTEMVVWWTGPPQIKDRQNILHFHIRMNVMMLLIRITESLRHFTGSDGNVNLSPQVTLPSSTILKSVNNMLLHFRHLMVLWWEWSVRACVCVSLGLLWPHVFFLPIIFCTTAP